MTREKAKEMDKEKRLRKLTRGKGKESDKEKGKDEMLARFIPDYQRL